MKRNDIKALAGMTTADLNKKLMELQKEVAKSRLEKRVGKLTNVRIVATLHDDIARVKTVLPIKEMEATV